MISKIKNRMVRYPLIAITTFSFMLYLTLLAYLLFFGYYRQSVTVVDYNLIPFNTIKMYLRNLSIYNFSTWFSNLFGNVLAFMPLGFFTGLLGRRMTLVKIFVLSFCLSLFAEIIQFVFHVGGFDVDDLLLNTIGGVTGYWLLKIVAYTLKKD